MGIVWTEEELKRLQVLFPKMSNKELMSHFPNRGYYAIISKAKALGLKKNKEVIAENTRKQRKKRGDMWTSEEIELIRKYYPIGGSHAVKEHLTQRTVTAIQSRAKLLGLRKEKRSAKWVRKEEVIEAKGLGRKLRVVYEKR